MVALILISASIQKLVLFTENGGTTESSNLLHHEAGSPHVVTLNDCIYLHVELQLTIISIMYHSADYFMD